MRIIANKWLWLLIFVLGWAAAGFAMFGEGDDGETSKATAGLPQRIVSMAPNLTELLFALGLEEEIVGVTAYSDYPEAAKDKAVMGTFWQPNIEAIVSAGTDMVVTLGFDQQTTLAGRLRRLGYETLTVDIETVEQLFDAIDAIGAATGKGLEARELSGRLRGSLDGISELVADKEPLKVLWIIQLSPLRVAGTETFVNELIELGGGVNAMGPTINKYPPIGFEQVISSDADVIIEAAAPGTDLLKRRGELLEYFGRFGDVEAVKNKRIYVIDGDTVSRLGARIDEGVETIAGCIRPELFEE
jgi:iron complex transport system substrate-binding protein